ncbi:putative GTPase-activating protein GYP7 [Rosellinia necatrix]|uniref:Putative GTPase-activating protein GYP7 n=1 Tax=Rosellinia necatrix TaxID=77044 RepID=A0A1W2TT53_ROSNE|nr:putative GTPase-activating protein GYP7 [Rosellinia necatrix]
MSGWYSNIVGATTSKISNLQRSYFSGEADGDTEDDTHVCRVLRSYYSEKGKPFPGWLPPDPKAPPPAAAVYSQPSQVGSRYGGLGQQQPGGSLSSLWDNNPSSQPQQETQSLRRGRGAAPPMRNSDARDSPFRNSDPMGGGGRDDIQARPLPSQRAGSHQNQSFGSGPTPSAGSGGGTAQDRLKQRLFGGARTASPAASSPFNPPPQRGGGGGSGDYEDRFAPGGMYDAGGSSRGGGGGGGGDRPYMSANSPWSSNEPDSTGSGGGGRPGRRPVGLPSGPRMR